MTKTTYGILYGAFGRSDYTIDSGYPTPDDARENYDPSSLIAYEDGMVGGAAVVEVDDEGCVRCELDDIAPDIDCTDGLPADYIARYRRNESQWTLEDHLAVELGAEEVEIDSDQDVWADHKIVSARRLAAAVAGIEAGV